MFDDKFADEFEFDILNATKLIPEERVPLRIVGRLFDKSGVTPDDGCLVLNKAADARKFVQMCAGLRFWEREKKVHVV